MKVCYFGIYRSDLGRSKIYIKGLRDNGVEVIECQDNSWGPIKFVKLFLKHWKIRNSYDFMIVGYTGHVVVPLAKLISKKKVIFDICCTMYEGVVISRKQYSEYSPKTLYIKFMDWMAVKTADVVLIESKAQIEFFEKRFGKSNKYKVMYTGTDDSIYNLEQKRKQGIKKNSEFTVIFRGQFLPEAGVRHVVSAAKILETSGIKFIIQGRGFLEREIKTQIARVDPQNLTLITKFLTDDELVNLMLSCDVSLGQLEDHERLLRTIPHKCYDTIALGIPYITARAAPVSEILKDGESVIFVNPGDSRDIADKILYIKNNPEIAKKIGEQEYEVYRNNLTPKILAQRIIALANNK